MVILRVFWFRVFDGELYVFSERVSIFGISRFESFKFSNDFFMGGFFGGFVIYVYRLFWYEFYVMLFGVVFFFCLEKECGYGNCKRI